MRYKMQKIKLERHEKDDLLDCDSYLWPGLFSGHPFDGLQKETSFSYGRTAITTLFRQTELCL
jgi:hypothetical protein